MAKEAAVADTLGQKIELFLLLEEETGGTEEEG